MSWAGGKFHFSCAGTLHRAVHWGVWEATLATAGSQQVAEAEGSLKMGSARGICTELAEGLLPSCLLRRHTAGSLRKGSTNPRGRPQAPLPPSPLPKHTHKFPLGLGQWEPLCLRHRPPPGRIRQASLVRAGPGCGENRLGGAPNPQRGAAAPPQLWKQQRGAHCPALPSPSWESGAGGPMGY